MLRINGLGYSISNDLNIIRMSDKARGNFLKAIINIAVNAT
jgi:hypothetical protein